MDTPQKPRVTDIIKEDYISKLTLIIPLAIWILLLITVLYPYMPEYFKRLSPLNHHDTQYYLPFAFTVTIVSIPIFILRIYSMMHIFKNGIEVKGRITFFWRKRDRGHIIYSYHYNDQTYEKGHALRVNEKMENLKKGDEIIIVVNKKIPKQSLIRDRYIQ
jgi:hypothetical protein